MKFVRPRCYFDVELSDIPLGRIVFELYSDICPITCENFRALCTGEKGIGKTTGKNLHYLNIVFHRVVKGFMIQSGDFSVGNGTGGESIYGGTFEDENFELKHDEPYLLSMANRGKDTNGSQFFITTQPAPHLDGIHVVFGHVVSGENVVSHIENLPVDKVSRPLQDVRVVKCNELVLKSKLKAKDKKKASPASASSGESEEKEEGEQSDSEREAKKRKKHKKEKKRKKKKKKSRKHSGGESEGESGVARGDANFNPITGTVSKIDPSEIPDVPTNSFLYRGGRDREEGGAREQRESVGRRRRRENIRGYTKSGRVIKGRGVFRYRTPSRSRSRSFTPPHWKQAEDRTIKLSEFQKLEQEKQEKEEEIKKREEARKRRHEEREKEALEEKKKRREVDNEEGADDKPKPQRQRRSRADSSTISHGRLAQSAEGEKPADVPEDMGPVDYNALDYDDDNDPEDPAASLKAKEDAGQILVVNSKHGRGHRSGQAGRAKGTPRQGTRAREGEKESSPTDEGDSAGDDKENDAESRRSSNHPAPLDRSPSPATRRRELEGVLRAKLLKKRQLDSKASKSRSLSREKSRRRRTLSRTVSRPETGEKMTTSPPRDKSEDRGARGSLGTAGDESGDGKETRDGKIGKRDTETAGKKDAREPKKQQEMAKRDATPDELFPDKDAVVSATLSQAVRRKHPSESPPGEKQTENGKKSAKLIGSGDKKSNGNRSRDKFKTTRKRSESRSASRERSSRKQPRRRSSRSREKRSRDAACRRSRSRERNGRARSRSPRRRDEKRSKRNRSTSSEQSDRKRDRKRSGERRRRNNRSRSRQSDGERPGRDGESTMKEQRSDEAKRKLTARLKELEKEREARGREKKRARPRSSSSSSSTSSDSD